MTIKIDNNIGNFEAYLISPEGINLGLITNIVSLDYIRMQIKKEQAEGHKVLFNGNSICISKNGILEHWPDEFCCYSKILDVLIGLVWLHGIKQENRFPNKFRKERDITKC